MWEGIFLDWGLTLFFSLLFITVMSSFFMSFFFLSLSLFRGLVEGEGEGVGKREKGGK